MSRDVAVHFRPLTQWPAGRRRTAVHEEARFRRSGYRTDDGAGGTRYVAPERTPLSTTYDELDRELVAIGARDVVVQLDVRSERELRSSDGYPLSKAVMLSPAVVLTFTRAGVPFTFATDWFKRWEDNLRAIVLGLEGLRRIERYHIGQAGEQYRGWQALPATTSPALSTETAAQLLARVSGIGDKLVDAARIIANDVLSARNAYRTAAARAHPDRGGSVGEFQLIQEAKRVLEIHLGATL